jgi:hypothetical protein
MQGFLAIRRNDEVPPHILNALSERNSELDLDRDKRAVFCYQDRITFWEFIGHLRNNGPAAASP